MLKRAQHFIQYDPTNKSDMKAKLVGLKRIIHDLKDKRYNFVASFQRHTHSITA